MSTEQEIPKEKLQRLRRDLRGHIKKVAKEADCAPATLYRVLNGDWVNMDLLKVAIDYRDKLQRNNNAIIAKL